MRVLVVYDVETKTKEGRRRLRRVAKVCLGYGDRVQKSVFECEVTERQLGELLRRAEKEVDARRDDLRVYRLPEGRGARMWAVGGTGGSGRPAKRTCVV